MNPTPSPIPTGSWLTIVLPDGGWQVLVSLLALVVSAGTLWYTLAARPRLAATAGRFTYHYHGRTEFDGDDVNVMNLGRVPVIVTGVCLDDDNDTRPGRSFRGPDRDQVPAPRYPTVIPAHGVLTVWMTAELAGPNAGHEPGYRIDYLVAGRFGRAPRAKHVYTKVPNPANADS